MDRINGHFLLSSPFKRSMFSFDRSFGGSGTSRELHLSFHDIEDVHFVRIPFYFPIQLKYFSDLNQSARGMSRLLLSIRNIHVISYSKTGVSFDSLIVEFRLFLMEVISVCYHHVLILSFPLSSYFEVEIRSQRRSFDARDSRISSAIKGSDNFDSEMNSSFRIFSMPSTNLLYLSQSTTNIRKIYHLITFQHGIVSTMICFQSVGIFHICSGSENLNELDGKDGSSDVSVQSRLDNVKKEEKREKKIGEGNESWSQFLHHFIHFIPLFSQRTLFLFRHW